MKISIIGVLLCMICAVATAKRGARSRTPYVKLGHASWLKGKQTTFRGVKVNLFLGEQHNILFFEENLMNIL